MLRRNIELALFQRKYWRRAAGGARKTARVPHSIAFCAIEWGHDTLRLSKNPSPLSLGAPGFQPSFDEQSKRDHKCRRELM